MTKRAILRRFNMLCMASFVSLAAFGEPVWVSDQFEVMLRTGPSTNNAIELMLGSGTELEILEEDVESGYSRVMTSGGTEGWVLSRYLMGEPGAREQLVTLTQQLTNANTEGTSMGSQLSSITAEYEAANNRVSDSRAGQSGYAGRDSTRFAVPPQTCWRSTSRTRICNKN